LPNLCARIQDPLDLLRLVIGTYKKVAINEDDFPHLLLFLKPWWMT